jgi:hypothetical protein
VRRAAEDAHPRDWHNRCGYVAFYGVQILNQFGTGYRVAEGKLEDLTESLPKVLWEGTYTGEGFSSLHVWIVGPNGEKIDCSVVPRSFGGEFMWEPDEQMPKLRYTEVPETTQSVEKVLARVVAEARARQIEGCGEK